MEGFGLDHHHGRTVLYLDFEGSVSVLEVEVLKDLYLLHCSLVNDAADR